VLPPAKRLPAWGDVFKKRLVVYEAMRVKSAISRVLDHLDVDVDRNVMHFRTREQHTSLKENINSESTLLNGIRNKIM